MNVGLGASILQKNSTTSRPTLQSVDLVTKLPPHVVLTDQFEATRALGYTALVPIIPPDASISEKSSLFKRVGTHQDARGKTPGTKGRDGNWSSFDWLARDGNEDDFKRWHAMGAGVGIKTGGEAGVIAIDADTLDLEHAKAIRKIVEARFGELPVRVGNQPKALYVVRVSEPIPYQRIDFGARNAKGVPDRVEILPDGRQFVAYGIHPKTRKPYSWPRPLPPLAELPVITPAELTALLDELRNALPEASAVLKSGGTEPVNQASLKGDIEHVRKAVAATPNTTESFPTRERYLDMGYAIKAALPDHEPEAFEIFQGWCDRWTDPERSNDPDVIAADWRRMVGEKRRGAGWLYEQAEQLSAGRFSQVGVWFDEIKDSDNPFAQLATEEAKGATGTFPYLMLSDILNRPPLRWLIQRHIPEHSVGFLYSVPGAGKSFLALDMALHMAAGLPEWHGDALALPEVPIVLYLAAEGGYGFKNRIEAWIKTYGHRQVLEKRFAFIEQTINFMSKDDVATLLRTVTEIARALGGRPVLTIVDTVSRAMPGADENLQKDMTLFVEACGRLKIATGGAVLGVHHAGKNGDMRGSTVLLGAGDFVFKLDRKKGATIGTFLCEKQKDAPDGWEERYRFDLVQLAAGETSLVVERVETTASPSTGPTSLTSDLAEKILEAMRAAWHAGKPWAKAYQSGPRWALTRMLDEFGISRGAAEEWLRNWEASGAIEMRVADKKNDLKGYFVTSEYRQNVQND